ncbi:MAG: hypothetical protein HYV29_16370 [Ignavibacteriales bacterium]|nr:hypothetical protein [Ignavibacteriales bacterium]
MSWAIANMWEEERAKDIARDIANIPGIYCGPAAIVWIAAVWNLDKGKTYDYKNRIRDKNLFPDGPRAFKSNSDLPGISVYQSSLNEILKRETDDELHLSDDSYYRYGTIHDELEAHDMPIIIRMMSGGFLDGLHYVTLYKSEKDRRIVRPDRIQFYWQDNGVYGKRNGGNPGLYKDPWRNIGLTGSFKFGSKRVVKTN